MTSLEHIVIDYPPYGSFKVAATSKIIRWRAKTFHTKEPTTIEWLQSLEKDAILIDIGANIGIYSIPAALFHVKKVLAVEPEIKNFYELIKNIDLNAVEENLQALPLAISTEFANSPSCLYLVEDEPGMSCHQIGRNQDFKLEPVDYQRKKRSTYCISLSSIVFKVFEENPVSPIHIKVDVDGIEEDVCQSLFDSHALNHVNSLQIELNPSIRQHKHLIQRLYFHGFSYSKAQVAKACRPGGTFKGFAEYVFRRYANKKIITLLPSQISSKFSICEDDPDRRDVTGVVIGAKNNFDSSQLFDYKTVSPAQISSIPPALVLPKFMNNVECLAAYSSVAQCLSDPVDFQFKSNTKFQKQSDSKRRSLSMRNLFTVNKPYTKFLFDFISDLSVPLSIFQSSKPLIERFIHLDPDQPFVDGYEVKVRVRHYLDLQGFYLDSHHDSGDTLFALICPLGVSSSSTSFFSRAPETHVRTQPNFQENIFTLESHFTPNLFYSPVLNDNNIVMEKKRGEPGIACSYLSKARLNYGDALIIPNITSSAYFKTSPAYKNDINDIGHGVFPEISDLLRPVLLIDYLVSRRNKSDLFGKAALSEYELTFNLCPLVDLA